MAGILRDIYARSHAPVGQLIRHFDNVARPRWSHCGAIVETRGEPFVLESRAFHGVVATMLDEFKARYAGRVEIVEYHVANPKAGDDWACTQSGSPYDYLAVFGKLFRQSWEEPGAWHCREFCEARLVAAGRRRFRGSPALITPNLGYMVLSE